jgi:hypothetical protein
MYPPITRSAKQILSAIERPFSSLNGIMAVSPRYISHEMKRAMDSPKPINRPIIVAEDQGYSDPPHCRARKNITIEGTKMAQPGRSRELSFWRSDCGAEALSVFGLDFGGWKKRMRVMTIIAPVGRLMRKHHRQVAWLVNAPPMSGATTVPIEKTETMRPVKTGRCSMGVTIAITDNPPDTTPEPPTPAIARPTMNIVEELATPQRSEPRRKIAKKDRYAVRRGKIAEILPARGCRLHIVRG